MKLPQLVDYQNAMVAPSVTLTDPTLRMATPRRNPLGLPSAVSGGLALTFELSVGDDRYAVRCFHKEAAHRRERYGQVADFIHRNRLPFLIDVRYVDDGIQVNGNHFPIVCMQWVDGTRLDDWIEEHLQQPAAIANVRRAIADAVAELRRRDIAHGDLQHGNVLVLPDHSIRLIDYDGMYVPSLAAYGSAETGHRNYQHPERDIRHYDSSLDRFSAAVIDLSLAAVAHDPRPWADFNHGSGEHLLFSLDDFTDPAGSALFTRLAGLPAVTEQTSRLRAACNVPIEAVPAALDGRAGTAAPKRSPQLVAAPQLGHSSSSTRRIEMPCSDGRVTT